MVIREVKHETWSKWRKPLDFYTDHMGREWVKTWDEFLEFEGWNMLSRCDVKYEDNE